MSAGKWSGNASASSSAHVKEGLLHGLPLRPHSLVGRKRDLEMSQALILRGNVRLVTITGPPGVGKTRFAIELASTIAPEFDDGVVFVDLAPVRDPGLVLDAIARALGVVDHPDQPVLQRLQRHLRDRNILLLLDNFEHVIAGAPDVADLLAACPDVKVLVTSRQPLHVRWEHRHNLLPLALPEATARSARDTFTRYPATALFVERARAVDAGCSAERNAPTVVEICRRLDGLPLAIELAAAWVGVLGLDAILSRLSDPQASNWVVRATPLSDSARSLMRSPGVTTSSMRQSAVCFVLSAPSPVRSLLKPSRRCARRFE